MNVRQVQRVYFEFKLKRRNVFFSDEVIDVSYEWELLAIGNEVFFEDRVYYDSRQRAFGSLDELESHVF